MNVVQNAPGGTVWIGQTWAKKVAPRRGRPTTIRITRISEAHKATGPTVVLGPIIAGPSSRTVLGLPAETSINLDDLLRDWVRV